MIHEQPYFFGKYEGVRTLFESDVCTVHLARHILLGHSCVIKRVKNSSNSALCLAHEAKLLSGLNNPGIPKVYDYFEDEESSYLVEEFVEGVNLSDFLSGQKTIPIKIFYSLAFELCEIFLYLHGQNDPVIYKDLKPEHVFIEQNHVRLIDFDTAFRRSEKDERLSYVSGVYGAPEVFKGQKASEKSDVYSLALVLKEMLSRVYEPEKSVSLNKIIEEALKPDPLTRTESVFALLEALKNESHKVMRTSERNLLKHVAVFGSRNGVGCTHIAISMTACLNSSKVNALFIDHNGENNIFDMTSRESSFVPGTLYEDGSFKGIAAGWPVEPEEVLTNGGVAIHDFGRYENLISGVELESFSCIIAVCSGRSFERASAENLLSRLASKENAVVIFNYDDKKSARENAYRFRKQMYTFPLDKDPFSVSKEKILLFKSLLKRKEVI
ncbi:MAG: serine/threonine protein kinase [Lachnospiraceae bacterium]|nr:serine/threonine protein kinase [Lachnospiraceae bacterium]